MMVVTTNVVLHNKCYKWNLLINRYNLYNQKKCLDNQFKRNPTVRVFFWVAGSTHHPPEIFAEQRRHQQEEIKSYVQVILLSEIGIQMSTHLETVNWAIKMRHLVTSILLTTSILPTDFFYWPILFSWHVSELCLQQTLPYYWYIGYWVSTRNMFDCPCT